MENKKKSIAALIVAKGKPSEEPSEGVPAYEGDDEGDELADEGLDQATEELMSALRANDVGAFKEAMKSFVSMCR